MKGILYKINNDCFKLYVNEATWATTIESPYRRMSVENCRNLFDDVKSDFTIEDIKKAYIQGGFDSNGIARKMNPDIKSYNSAEEYIESILSKNSVEVKVKMRSKNIDELRQSNEGFLNNQNLWIPELDNNGNVILERI